jgi:DEAD/DEAH box helicase domain-containing protein
VTEFATTARTPLDRLLASVSHRSRVTHIEHFPTRAGVRAEWPGWVAGEVIDALIGSGVTAPWTH